MTRQTRLIHLLRKGALVACLAALLPACGAQPGGGAVDANNAGQNSALLASNDLDTSELVPREKAMFDRLLETTYSPCTDQAVPLDTCLAEKRSCSGCRPAAQFLLDRVKSGFTSSDIQRAYAMRFGGDVRKIDIADSPTKGPNDAPVTVMVWSDFECPACKRILPLIESIYNGHDKDVRLVHKLYPIPKHPHSEIAARAAYAAKLQGKYWEMERALFDNQSRLSEQTISELAEELGLDMKKFRVDSQSEGAKKVIDRDMNEADKAGLTGTPFILINGREFNFDLFRPEVDLEPWIKLEIEVVRGRK